VYEPGSIQLDFGTVSGADTADFAGEPGQLIVASFEENRQTSDVAALDDAGELLEDALDGNMSELRTEADNRNITFEIVDESDFGGSGVYSHTLNADDPGPYGVLLARVDDTNEEGFTVNNNGQLELPGEATIVGVEMIAVQQRQSSLTVPDSTAPGSKIDVDASTSLSGNVSHTVVVYNESEFTADTERTNINVTDGTLGNLSSENVTIEHTIDEVNGVLEVTQDGQVFGNGIAARTLSGKTALGDILDKLNESADTDFQRKSIGSSVLNASGKTVPNASSDETITVETLGNWSAGEYRVIHVAENGTVRGFETSTDTITIQQTPPNFVITDLSVDPTAPKAGNQLTVNVSVENRGGQSGTQTVTVTYDGETFEQDVTLSEAGKAGDSETVTFTIQTDKADAGDQTITAATDDDATSTLVTLEQPTTFLVDVIGAESDLSVPPTADANLTVVVQNTGDSPGTQTIEAVNQTGFKFDSETVQSLGAGATTDIVLTLKQEDIPDSGTFDVIVQSENDSATQEITIKDQAIYEVNINGTGTPDSVDEGGEFNPTVDVENIGSVAEDQVLEYRVDGELRETRTVNVGSGNNVTFDDVSIDIEYEDANVDFADFDLEVSSADDSDNKTIGVDRPARFTVNITDTNASGLQAGDEFIPNITVENVGDEDGNVNGSVSFGNSTVNTTSFEPLQSGATASFEPTINTSDFTSANDAGEFRLVAESKNRKVADIDTDDRVVETVVVGEVDEFNVDIDEANSDTNKVQIGETLDIQADISNDGGADGTQTIELTFEGSTVDRNEDITITSGNSQTETFKYKPRLEDLGTSQSVTVATDDDQDNITVDVVQPAEFDVDIQSITDEIIAQETATVTTEVTNIGGVSGSDTVRLFADGQEVASETTNTLAADGSQAITLDYTPTDAGTDTLGVTTSNDLESEDVEVGAPGELDLEVRSVTDPVTSDDTVVVTVTVENTGDGAVDSEDLTLLAGEGNSESQVNQTSLPTIDGGNTTTERIQYDLSNQATGELPLRVTAGDAEATTSTEVFDSLEDFRVAILDAPSSVLNEESATITVEVTNLGGGTASQDIELSTGGETLETKTTSSLSNGGSETLDFTFDTTNSAISTGEISYTVSSADQSETDTIVVEERTDPTLEIAEVLSSPDSVRQERDINVTIELENTGDDDFTNPESFELNYTNDDTVINTSTVTLDAGETTTESLIVTAPSEPFAGTFERDLTVETADDSTDLDVDVDFRGIQSGIDAAAATNADTVTVASDFRQPRNTITVDTPVTIEGVAGASRPVIESPQNDDVALRVETDGVELNRLEFSGDGSGSALVIENRTTLFGVAASEWSTGIRVTGGSNHDFRRVRVSDTDTGIRLAGGGSSQLRAVSVVGTADTGILVESDDNELRQLTLRNPDATEGIRLEANDTSVSQSLVRGSQFGALSVDIREDANNPAASFTENNFVGLNNPLTVDSAFVEGSDNWYGFAAADTDELLNRGAVVVRSGFSGGPAQQQNDPPEYNIKNTNFPSQSTYDEEFNVTADVENIGDLDGDLDVELVNNGTVIDSASGLELNSSETKSVELSYTPDRSDGEQIDLVLRTNDQVGSGIDDSTATNTVDLLDPASFTVNITDASPDPVEVGETLDVDIDLENTGEAQGTETVSLAVDGTNVDSQQETVAGTEQGSGSNVTSVTLSYSPSSGEIGTGVPVTASVPGDSDQVTVDIESAPSDGGDGGGGAAPAEPQPEVIENPDEVGPPEGVELLRAERAQVTIDDETGRPRVTFTEESTTESITFEGDEVEGEVTVADYDTEPDETGPSPGRSVSVTEITVPDPDQPATIRKRVSTARLEEVEADAEDLRINRFNEDAGEWQGLDTEVVETTDERVVLEADTPGFSFFSVSAVSEPEAVIAAPSEVEIGEEFTLDASDSSDEYGEIVAYDWSVAGDTLTGETATTAIDTAGDVTVELTVENDAGETDTTTATITVLEDEAGPDGEDGDDAGPDGEDGDEAGPDGGDEEEEGGAGFWVIGIVILLIIGAIGALLFIRYRNEEMG
jgi:PGF-pre-PGF domain-containing protein